VKTVVTDEPRTVRLHKRLVIAILAGVTLFGFLSLALYAATVGDSRFAERGDPNPGRLVSVLDVVGYFAGVGLVGLSLGALVYVITCARFDDTGFIDATVYPAQRTFARATCLLAFVAWGMVIVAAADGAGLSLGKLMSTDYVFDAIAISEKSIAWLTLAVCATVSTVLGWVSLSWMVHFVALVPTGIAATTLFMAGNAGQGPNHDYSTALGIFFALALTVSFGIRVAAARAPVLDSSSDRQIVDRRRAWITLVSDAVGLLSALALLGLLLPFESLFSTPFGEASWVMIVAMLAALVASVRALRATGEGRDTSRVDLAGSVAMLAAIACWAVMDTRVAPGLLTHPFTAWDVFLGYELPGPPTAWTLATFWRFDFFIGLLAIVAALAYLIGVRRLKARGDTWPAGRTLAWATGCILLVLVVCSGVRSYGSAMFSVHMAEHMALNMFVPVLLVLGAPATLALRTLPAARAGGPPGPREWILKVLHSKVTAFLSNPVIALVIFVLSLYIVYFSPIFGTFARYHWGHVLLTLHFLIVGYLFFWVIIGIDPGPRRIPYLARIGLLFAVMPFHAFFGIALMTMSTVIGDKFYGQLDLPWISDRLDDQWLGGAIAWGISEIPVLIVVVAIVAQWAKSDNRAGRRADRHAATYEDAELDDYNAMLEELARSRR